MINVAFTWRYVNIMQSRLLSYSLNYLSRLVTTFCMNKIFIKFQMFIFVCFSVFLFHGATVNVMAEIYTVCYTKGVIWEGICMSGETVVT